MTVEAGRRQGGDFLPPYGKEFEKSLLQSATTLCNITIEMHIALYANIILRAEIVASGMHISQIPKRQTAVPAIGEQPMNANLNLVVFMTIEEALIRQYGPLLSVAQLAKVLDRSEGLRITLRTSGDWVVRINAARIQVGRRVYFRTSEIAVALGDQ